MTEPESASSPEYAPLRTIEAAPAPQPTVAPPRRATESATIIVFIVRSICSSSLVVASEEAQRNRRAAAVQSRPLARGAQPYARRGRLDARLAQPRGPAEGCASAC